MEGMAESVKLPELNGKGSAASLAHGGRQAFREPARALDREVPVVDEVGAREGVGRYADIDIAQRCSGALEHRVEALLQRPEVAVPHQRQPAVPPIALQLFAVEQLPDPDRGDVI